MKNRSALVALSLLSFAGLAAQSVVVPNANAGTRGTGSLNTLVRNSGNPRTYMLGFNASQLAGIPVGSVITGASFRFGMTSNPTIWPTSDITWSDYKIWVGSVQPLASWTGGFMANFSGTPTLVRSGPMTLPANTYAHTSPAAPAPNPWGEFYFDFQTPHVYTGGDLGLLFSHPGSNDSTTARYLETVTSSSGSHGIALTQSAYPGTSGSSAAMYVTRLHFGYGQGCAGASGTAPVMVLDENTTGGTGGTALFTVSNGPAGAPMAFAFGAPRIQAPYLGCTILTNPVVVVPLGLDARGSRQLPVPVPAGLSVVLQAQAVVLDAGGPFGLTFTNAVEFTGS